MSLRMSAEANGALYECGDRRFNAPRERPDASGTKQRRFIHMIALKCTWQVTAGMLPGQIDPKFTRRYEITNTEWAKASAAGDGRMGQIALLLSRSHEATAYANSLQISCALGMEPNWVTIELVWM
jgi:hypothetical protein